MGGNDPGAGGGALRSNGERGNDPGAGGGALRSNGGHYEVMERGNGLQSNGAGVLQKQCRKKFAKHFPANFLAITSTTRSFFL